MWRREESEVERAGRAPPSAPPTGSGGVSEDHQWRDEDPSWRQRGTAPSWIPAQPQDYRVHYFFKISQIFYWKLEEKIVSPRAFLHVLFLKKGSSPE